VGSLLVVVLLEASTPQNDHIIAAYLGSIIYFLFAFREKEENKYLALAALDIGLVAGASAKSFIYLPLAFFIAGYVLISKKTRFRNIAYFSASIVIAIVLFTLPAGYVENYRNFGHPLGTRELREFSFSGKPIEYIAQKGSKNLLRYGLDNLSLDGLPPLEIVRKTEAIIKALPRTIIEGLGIDLESGDLRTPFTYEKPAIFFSHEGWSSWGIFGFALIWIVVLLSLIGVIRSRDNRIMSFAAIMVILAMSFEGYYELHRGRFLISCAVFAVPTIGIMLRTKRKTIQAYVLLVVLLGCISAVSSVVLRPARPLVSASELVDEFPQISEFQFLPKSIFEMGRLAQVMANAWGLYPAYKAYDLLVPEDATVAVYLYGDNYYSYPLFGENLTREIIPINSFVEGFKEIPKDADYLLYLEGFPQASSRDLRLGSGLRLRRLPGADDDAIEYYEEALKLRPGHAPYHNRLGIEYAEKKMFDKAIEEFKEAVRLNPDESSYRSNLDKALELSNSTDE